MELMRGQALGWLTMSGLVLVALSATGAAQDRPAASATAEQQDLSALTQAVDAAAGKLPTAESPITWLANHFIRSQGESVYVPFSVSIDRQQFPGASATVYVRAVSRSAPAPAAAAAPGAPKFAWETLQPVDVSADGHISRAIALTPGVYDVFVGVREKGAATPPKVAVLRHELTVPTLTGSEITTSSVILSKAVEQLSAPLPADKQQDNPYVIGTYKVTPSIDGTFSTTSSLYLVFWIYNASQMAGKPDVQVDFSFHRRLPEGEKYFNRTNPQELSAKTLPAEFNLAVGHQLSTSLSVPLASFPPGDYRLEIKVTDKPSGKSLTSSVNFAVSAS